VRPAGSTTLDLKVDGVHRVVVVHVPQGYTGTTRAALVLNLHGSGSTAVEEEGFSGMDATADARGFIVAYPQGVIQEAGGFAWNVPGVPLFGGAAVRANAANDIEFLKALVGILEAKYCVNTSRVYAAGFSGGAREASQLACDDSSQFAAVAAVSGLRHPAPCPASRPVPIIAFHGSADPVDPFAGHGQAYWTYSVKTAAREWGAQDGCLKEKTSQPSSDVVLYARSACKGGASVELYEVMGEGHEWPGGPSLPPVVTSVLGPQSSAIDANELIWSFFESHPLA
jgi:polyhydroxybutyrate depolymerase